MHSPPPHVQKRIALIGLAGNCCILVNCLQDNIVMMNVLEPWTTPMLREYYTTKPQARMSVIGVVTDHVTDVII
jgi:hypothetical protein